MASGDVRVRIENPEEMVSAVEVTAYAGGVGVLIGQVDHEDLVWISRESLPQLIAVLQTLAKGE